MLLLRCCRVAALAVWPSSTPAEDVFSRKSSKTPSHPRTPSTRQCRNRECRIPWHAALASCFASCFALFPLSSAVSAFVPNFHCIASRLQQEAPRRQPAAVADGGDIPADAATAASLEAPLLGALGKMDKVMKADFFMSQPSLKQLYGKSTKSIAVKDISIKGAGKGDRKSVV